jgi:hypothetical protein
MHIPMSSRDFYFYIFHLGVWLQDEWRKWHVNTSGACMVTSGFSASWCRIFSFPLMLLFNFILIYSSVILSCPLCLISTISLVFSDYFNETAAIKRSVFNYPILCAFSHLPSIVNKRCIIYFSMSMTGFEDNVSPL